MRTRTIAIVFMALMATFSGYAQAIPKSVKAKSEFILAEQLFEQRDYKAALGHLDNAKILLSQTNSKIQYMLVKCHYFLNDYEKAKAEIELYFAVTPETESSSAQHSEMVVMVAQIEAGLERVRQRAAVEAVRHKRQEALARQQREEKARQANTRAKKNRQFVCGRWRIERTYNAGYCVPKQQVTIYQAGTKVTFSVKLQKSWGYGGSYFMKTVEGTFDNGFLKISTGYGLGSLSFEGSISELGTTISCKYTKGCEGHIKFERVDYDESLCRSGSAHHNSRSAATCFVNTIFLPSK